MTTQYLRNCQLLLENETDALDLSEMHVQFHVHQALVGTPNWAVIRVFNLSQQTIQLAGQEYRNLSLSVGYEGELGTIFEGVIRQFNAGRRLNATDTFIDFVCQDGDFGYNHTSVNRTLSAGWSRIDEINLLQDEFSKNGIGSGHKSDLPSGQFPRGKVYFGAARDYMYQLSDNVGADWSIQDNKLILVGSNQNLPQQAIDLTAETGLIGLPEQTVDGINLKCLINPKIKFGGVVKLDNSAIQAANISPDLTQPQYIPGIDRDGLYKVFSISHTGDTRGNDWYSDIICAGLTADWPLDGIVTRVIPNSA